MNERELRDALRGAMITTSAPPPMNSTVVLDAARRAARRRRAGMAGAASAFAVVLIAVGAIILFGVPRGGGSIFAGSGPGVSLTTEPPDTQPTWPDGQTDRTATSGPRFDKGVQLVDLLNASVPEAMRAPTDLAPAQGAQLYGGLRNHQAQYEDTIGGKQVWEYQVSIPIGAEGKWGQLMVQVVTAGNQLPDTGCGLTTQLWGLGGECSLVPVGGKELGVAIHPTGDTRFDQWAGYRHLDGTVVFIAQAKTYSRSGLPGLTNLPFTPQQLAELAMDPKFRLS